MPTTRTVPASAGKRVYFISDVHLGYGDRETDRRRETLLVQLLRRCADDAAHIFLVGDLFDAWFDYRTVIPAGHVRTLAALTDLVDAGVPMTYLMGNHDFGHHHYFRDHVGLPVVADDVVATIGSRRYYLAHGDGKAHNDTGYLILRAVLRNPFAKWLYRLLHPDLGIGLASRTSHGSRDYTTKKDYGAADGLRDFALARLDEGFDAVIMGHRHQVHSEQHGAGLYVNLGHWLGDQPTFGVYTMDTDELRVGLVRPFLAEGRIRLV